MSSGLFRGVSSGTGLHPPSVYRFEASGFHPWVTRFCRSPRLGTPAPPSVLSVPCFDGSLKPYPLTEVNPQFASGLKFFDPAPHHARGCITTRATYVPGNPSLA
nr:MAG TPA: hypothetical protein [Caudoviricetes sp.]